ncbi:hypothetical protein V7S43_016401 [Phytophthora oleae]|uniref:Secreted protein n=1 Tax=Phytophthora oleae TaxID=2107226 RepID=A0ABD3EVH7_9STRA
MAPPGVVECFLASFLCWEVSKPAVRCNNGANRPAAASESDFGWGTDCALLSCIKNRALCEASVYYSNVISTSWEEGRTDETVTSTRSVARALGASRSSHSNTSFPNKRVRETSSDIGHTATERYSGV